MIYSYKMMVNNDLIPYMEKNKRITIKDTKMSSYNKMVDILNRYFKMSNLGTEHCFVMALTNDLDLIGIIELSNGDSKNSIINNRELFIGLLKLGAEQFVVFHNHVNGTLEPSGNDYLVTANITQASNLLNIRFLNHIIISKNGFKLIIDK